jgi:hypothetical protein
MTHAGWQMRCRIGDGKCQMADDTCRMADDTCRMADDTCRMADDRCEVRSGGCGEGESGEPTPEVSQGRIVGYDSNRVIDDSMNDKIGILSHEETDAAERPCQGAGDRQSLPGGLKTPQKAPNEAKPESTQSSLSHGFESSAPEAAGHERSRFAADGAVPHGGCNDPFDPITPAREGKETGLGQPRSSSR